MNDMRSAFNDAFIKSAQNNRKVSKVMHEFKNKSLHDSHGNLVKSRDQAIAIALSEARSKES